MLADATRRQLQRLRFLLEEAIARSQDPTEIGRHSALILLDGACEYAMAIALGHVGRSEWKFEKKFERLRSEFEHWQPDSWSSISQLHRARNHAQHHGIVVDASSIPGWVAETQRFIGSLVVASFGLELQSVLLADSVETEDIRLQMIDAEKALQQGDAVGALSATFGAFDTAREAWRDQRIEAIGQLQLQYSGMHRLGGVETDPINISLQRVEDLLEVQPFAPDIGEYHWFLTRRAESEHEMEPKLESANRAYLFVLGWVLRWEAFATRYEARRYPPPPPEYQPPITGSDHPVIVQTLVEEQHHLGHWLDSPTLENVRFLVRFVLADIPKERLDVWAQEVNSALDEAVADRNFDDIGAASVGSDGIVRFHGVSAKVSGEAMRAWVEYSLTEGDKRFRARLSELLARDAKLPKTVGHFAAALQTADTGDLVIGVISDERDDGSVWIGIQLRRDADPIFGHGLDNIVHRHRSNTEGVDYFHTTIWFTPNFDPQEAARLVAAIAIEYQAEADQRRRGIKAVEQRRQALESELEA